jgi:hypothetical protein
MTGAAWLLLLSLPDTPLPAATQHDFAPHAQAGLARKVDFRGSDGTFDNSAQ